MSDAQTAEPIRKVLWICPQCEEQNATARHKVPICFNCDIDFYWEEVLAP